MLTLVVLYNIYFTILYFMQVKKIDYIKFGFYNQFLFKKLVQIVGSTTLLFTVASFVFQFGAYHYT